MRSRRTNTFRLLVATAVVPLLACAFSTSPPAQRAGAATGSPTWSIGKSVGGGPWQFGFGSGGDFPQVAALHPNDGYFRLVRKTTFGTSVVLPPAFWSGGVLSQGMLLDVKDPVVDTANRLIIEAKGQKNGLRVSLKVTILPPEETRIQAVVEGKCETTVPIDSRRPCEGFKPVMLSSMRVGDGLPSREWDARAVIIEGKPDQEFDDRVATNAFFLPPESDTRVRRFGFRGGKSDFQPGDPAPTVELTFPNPVRIAGYRTQSTNHDDDNLGLWAGSDTLVDSWTYTITAMRPAD